MLQTAAASPHLFLRNNIFYFRVVIPERHRPAMGKREVRMSLGTAYRRDARDFARKQFSAREIPLHPQLVHGLNFPNRTGSRSV
ncbi:MAG: DUF6538 domain-containing protein [Desulfovibrionales bacterium]